jgi:hypothetical protein
MNGRHFLPCLVLAAVVAALIGVAGVSSATVFTVGAALACPLVMVVMMRAMGGHAVQNPAGDERQTGEAK